jgi:hypothetical protein
MDMWFKPGGCKEKVKKCQEQADTDDPDWGGNIPSVSECFKDAEESCLTLSVAHDIRTVRSLPRPVAQCSNWYKWGWYDIAHPKADPTPEPCQSLTALNPI